MNSKIGILSDTHNNHNDMQRALQKFRQQNVRILCHCGDLTSAKMLKHFNDFEVYLVRGNMDRLTEQTIHATADDQSNLHWLGKGQEIEINGKRISITHSDQIDVMEKLLFMEPDYLLHGHTHRRRDDRIGSTRVINPGALGGTEHETRSICVLDLETDQLEFIQL